MNGTATEHKAANILLKRGVQVPVTAPLFLRLFGIKQIKLVISAPTTHTLILIAEKYLSLRIQETKDLTLPQSFELLKLHGKAMTEIIATCILNNPRKMWRHRFLASFIAKKLTAEELSYLFHLIIIYGGIEDFINTIRSTEAMKITKPMNLSPKEKMS